MPFVVQSGESEVSLPVRCHRWWLASLIAYALKASRPLKKVLVAGVGNVLRSDDGFGVEVARRLSKMDLSDWVTVVETGIAGMALIQELSKDVDLLIVVDAVDRSRAPGTVMVIEPDIIDVHLLSPLDRYDILADVHLATPERVFVMAKALGVLPHKVLVVGCQPVDAETMNQGMSEIVVAAVEPAIGEILALLSQYCDGVQPDSERVRKVGQSSGD